MTLNKFLCSLLTLLLTTAGSRAVTNSWVYFGTNGNLSYQVTSNGNQIMDFSEAGYMGGGVAIPTIATVQTLNPSGGDDTSALQSAINSVASRSLVNGVRGALQLGAGTFIVSGQLNINASGVVLRGAGSGAGGTTLQMTNASPFTLLSLSGSGSPSKSGTVSLTDPYIPSGTNTVVVSSASGFSVGDTILLNRTVTTNWIHFMGMDTLVRSGVTQTWISAGTVITTDRKIQQINGNHITLDAPVTDSFDTNYLGIPAGTMSKYSWSGRISQVGLEHLHILAPAATNGYQAFNMANIVDSWARDITIQDGINSVVVQNSAKRCTVDNVSINRTLAITGDPPADYTVTGTQILMNKCSCNGTGVWPFVTQATGTGPIVALQFFSAETRGVEPHQRWSVGLLTDNCSLPNAPSGEQGIAYFDRGTDGSGHGWTMGWGVAWNDVTPYFLVTEAPGTLDWVIGGIGSQTSKSGQQNGVYDHFGSIVTPHSIYLEQLKERLGGAAVENIGYTLFTISNSPPARTISAGTNTTFAVTVGDPTLMSNVVALSVSGLPANSSAAFSTNSVTGSGSATLTVTASNSIAPGNYTLNVMGTSAGLTHTSQVSLVVGSFSLSASPASQTVLPGNGTNYTVSVTTNSSFSGEVDFGVSGLPSGASAGFVPTSLFGSGSSTLSVTTTIATPPGSYPLTIYGTNAGVAAVATATLVVGGSATSPLWDGASASGSFWNDSANWSGVTLAANDALIFDGNQRLNNTNNTTAGTAYSNIVFNPGASAFTLNGNPVTLSGNITNNSSNPQTVDLGLNFNTSITFNGLGNSLIIGNGLTNTLGAPGSTTLTLAGTGILTNLLKSSTTSPGGTNLVLLNSSTANWTLEDNASSAAMSVPWALEVSSGTFNFGDGSSAPTLSGTSAQGTPIDNQVGTVSGSTGTLNMVNGTFTTSARLNTATALNSTGIINQTGGTLNIGSQFQGANGGNAGEVSLVNVNGGSMNIGGGGGTFYVASRGTGTLTVSGSGVVNCGKLDISRNAAGNTISSAGVVNLDGGTLMVTSVTNVSANQQTGGTPTAAFNFNGGVLVAKSGSATGFFQGSAATPITPITTTVKAGGAIIDDGGNAITIAEPLRHDTNLDGELDGGLTKLDTGTLTLTATNTYTGDTTISNGTLVLSGNGSISNSDNILVNGGALLDASARGDTTLAVANGQTLTGNGAVNGNVVVDSGGTLAPGGGLTTMTFNNNLTLNSGSMTVFEINKSASPSNDMAQVAGTVNYGGTLMVTNLAGTYAAGDNFKLFNAAAYSGAFSNIVPVIPDVNLAWNTNGLSSGVLSVVAAPTPPPAFSGVTATGGNYVFSGSNGVMNWPYYVLASTNANLPLTSWTILSTNAFDSSGNFIFSNTPDPNAAQMFFILQVP
jgi:autotransporter-associated beta strand protein